MTEEQRRVHERLMRTARTHYVEPPVEVKQKSPAAERARRWRLENPDKEKATKARYREANRERLRQYFRDYRAKNIETIRENERRYQRKKKNGQGIA